MTIAVQTCGDPEPDDICERIRGQIRKLVFQTKDECGERGLRERMMDQINGRHGPGTQGWVGHDIAIDQLKNRIDKLMQDFFNNNCGGGTPIGRDATYWIERPNPLPSEWKGPKPEEPTARSIWDWEYWEEVTGLTGAALVLYLIVSEGSRLYPPTQPGAGAMKRSPSYWLWLLADLSLDRAATILPLIDFPAVNHALVQGCIDSVGEDLNPRQEDKERPIEEIRGCFSRELGENAGLVDTWLQTFPFTDEPSAPTPSYWNLRFLDLLGVDPAPAPNGVDTELWESFRSAFRGKKPDPGYPWTAAFHEAARAISKYDAVARAIEKARNARLTPHDLAIYMRFGWNDYGTQNGLASLEIGAQLSAVISFWRAVSEYVPAEALESLAYRRDMEAWEIASDPALFVADAQRYGVRPEQLAADVCPRPSLPPRLSTLLETT